MSSASLTPSEQAAWGDDRRPAIYAVVGIFGILANIAVFLRLFSQYRLHRKVWTEDWCFLAGIILTDVVSIVTILDAALGGVGLHVWRAKAESPNSIQDLFFYAYLQATISVWSIYAARIGLLFFYRRIFLVSQTWLKIIWWFLAVYCTGWAFAAFFVFVFPCNPVKADWMRFNTEWAKTHDYHCSYTHWSVSTLLILGFVSDLAICVLPSINILKLKMDLTRKIGLMALFSVGLVTIGVSLARVVVLLVADNIATDPSWGETAFDVFAPLESDLALICASVVPIFSMYTHEKTFRRPEQQVGYYDPEAVHEATKRPMREDSLSTEHSRRGYMPNNYNESMRSVKTSRSSMEQVRPVPQVPDQAYMYDNRF